MILPFSRVYLSTALLLLLAVCPLLGRADNLIENPGFELGRQAWDLFVPPGGPEDGPRFEILHGHGVNGSLVARLVSPSIARFSIASRTSVKVQPGMRFRARVMYRVEPGFEVRSGALGVVLRATFVPAGSSSGPVNHYFIAPDGQTSFGPSPQIKSSPLADTWTPIFADFTVPPGVERMALNFFVWHLRGTVLVDDFSLERLPDLPSSPTSSASPSAQGRPPLTTEAIQERRLTATGSRLVQSGGPSRLEACE